MLNPFKNLSFDARGYRYQEKLFVIKETLSAANDGLTDRRRQVVQEFDEYEKGNIFIGEREEGHVLWEQSHVLQHKIDAIDEAILDLRKPYVMALYHTWERAVGEWAGHTKAFAKHEQLAQAMQNRGINLHPRLAAIRDLNNALKHNSTKYGPNLLQSWPEILPKGFIPPNNTSSIRWYDIINISEGQMNEIFEALSKSGPQAFPKP